MKRLKFLFLPVLLHCNCLFSQQWKQLNDSAEICKAQKITDKAIGFYTRSINALPPDSLNSGTYIRQVTNLADLLYNGKSDYAFAENWYLNARSAIIRQYGKDNNLYAANANYLGQVNYYMKQYDKAVGYYREAKDTWQKLYTKSSAQYAGMCNALGVLYNDNGQYEMAEALHLEAREIRAALFTRENGAYAQSCNNLAALYWNLGEYDKAEPLALEAKDIRGSLAAVPRSAYAISCINLANIYRDMGKYKQAEQLYIEAKKVRENFFTKEHEDYALSCDILANLYYYMKQYDKAEPLYLEAKAIREKLAAKGSYFYAQGCSSLSALYRQTGKYPEALALALEANNIWMNIGSLALADLAVNNNSLGELYFDLKQYDLSEEYILKARGFWEKSLGIEHPFYTDNSLALAKVYWCRGKTAKAGKLYKDAFEAQLQQAGRIFSFTSETEKVLYLQNIAGAEDEYQSFYLDRMDHDNNGEPYHISLMKRNQVLSSSQQLRRVIYSSGDTAIRAAYTNWTNLRQQLAALYARGDAAPREHLKAIEQQADNLEKQMVRTCAAFRESRQAGINWKTIQMHLKPSEAAIEFISFHYFNGRRFTDSTFYRALILRGGAMEPEAVTLFEQKQLESLLRSTAGGKSINAFYSRGISEERDSSTTQQAYNIIWKPIQDKLAGVNKIYFAPSGLLHKVAFAALPIDSITTLSDRYQLVQLSTTGAITDSLNNPVTASDKITLFGGIRYVQDSTVKRNTAAVPGDLLNRSGFDYLPGTEKEVKEIAKAGRKKGYTAVIFTGLSAKEEILKSFDGKASPSIIHIATHGFFFNDPQNEQDNANRSAGGKVFQRSGDPLFRSGLLFAGANDAWNGKYVESSADDGILTAYEVSNLFLPNTRLVVLSACETALGDIKGSEGVYGLQRAFKMAGVQNLLMSLWKVPDNETAEFMQVFYSKMFSRVPIDVAFYETQKEMRNKYRGDPYKWAAWILVK